MVERYRPQPSTLNIVAAMNHAGLFKPWFEGASWDGWRTVLKAAFGLPMNEAERAFFRTIAEREPPTKPVRELWCVVGRGGGKGLNRFRYSGTCGGALQARQATTRRASARCMFGLRS